MIIVSAANNRYAKHLGVMLHSLMENISVRDHLQLFIIDGEIHPDNKAKLNRLVERYRVPLTFLTPKKKRFKDLPRFSKARHITNEAYYRIVIPELLSEAIPKALYLDCDLIVNSDMAALWNTDISTHYAAAVDESCLLTKGDRKRRNRLLSLPQDAMTFNSGVMLLNLRKWRNRDISERVLRYIRQNADRLRLIDQDALNAVLHKKWLPLDPTWNYTDSHWRKIQLDHPAIIHYTGPHKPWNSDVKYKETYLQYLQSSLWDAEE